MELNIGKVKENTLVKDKIVTDKVISTATGSCGCTNLSFTDNEINYKWKIPAVPFQITSGEYHVSMSIMVWFTDGTKEDYDFKAISVK